MKLPPANIFRATPAALESNHSQYSHSNCENRRFRTRQLNFARQYAALLGQATVVTLPSSPNSESLVTRALKASDFEAVHSAFVEAFSDYVVKLSPTREQLAEMLTRRGYCAEASTGAFEGDRLVAFALNCIENTSAYNTGTGAIPSHRRRGLGRKVMESSYAWLRSRGCTSYVLEVFQQNQAALALYCAGGFVERRRLQSWAFEAREPSGVVPT